ncbi:MAG: AtpZ/AtpI family protein [Patescibacteria group bacterium]|nr:AtpZ/AtpI family protein [Patescibacteria group bacterium]
MLKKQDKKTENESVFSALSLAFELGYIIAIPIVGFALGGRLLDRKFDSTPIFLLLGIFVAILLSSYFVYRKTKKIMQNS